MVLLPSEPAPLGVRVDVWVVPEGEEEEVQLTEFLPEGSREVVLRLPPSGNGLDYRWGATAYTSEGEQDVGSGEGESSVLILRVS